MYIAWCLPLFGRRIEKEKHSGEFTEEADTPSYADVKPEIHVNPAFFKNGDIPDGTIADGEESEQQAPMDPDELDREYFDWKDGPDDDEPKKKGLFSVFKK